MAGKRNPWTTALAAQPSGPYTVRKDLVGIPSVVRSLMANVGCKTEEEGLAAVDRHLVPYLKQCPDRDVFRRLVREAL